MRVIRVHETGVEEHGEIVRHVFRNATIVNCGLVEFAPGSYSHEGERHVHEYDEVFIVLTGEITVPISGGPTDVARAGDWILVEAGEEHHVTNHTGLPCRTMFLIMRRACTNAGTCRGLAAGPWAPPEAPR